MRIMEYFRTKSIRYLLKVVFVTIITCFLATSFISLIYMRRITAEYGKQISNIEFANSLSRVAREEVARESWYIVAGRQQFADSGIYQRLADINRDLAYLYDNTTSGRQLVDAAARAHETLIGYVDRLREQCEQGIPISYRQLTLTEINKVSDNIYDVLQEFCYTQITGIARANEEMQQASLAMLVLLALLSLLVTFIAIAAYRMLKEAVERPNVEIAAMADRVLQGDLTTQVPPPGMEELNKLAGTINLMAGRIRTLVDNSIEEQKNLQKAELRALQAQITPHFVYNTFDTIVWLAECGHTEQVVKLTIAFSNYYRIALSSGRDFIPVSEEVEHVRDYLIIQGTRYDELLRYEIDVAEEMGERRMLKLLLQPLVENALYHGIKNKRDIGKITVRGRLLEDGSLTFTVEDDGVGMDEKTLLKLREEIAADHLPETSGYGLYNVNRRLRLFYGAADLQIESERGKGTAITFILPPPPEG